MTLLITGSAGFIGFHLSKYCLEQGETVVGTDNLNDYYDVRLKKARLKELESYPNFLFYPIDLVDVQGMKDIFTIHRPSRVVNLAAQAGVRYSLTHPEAYVQSNMVGFSHLIELCRQFEVAHLVYASTSSVYGANLDYPYAETSPTNHPMTLYAATKKSNELVAHAYSNLYGLPTTGLRFFTVYGPWGRPDMAFFSFTQRILQGLPIQVYNYGNMQRDFTYIDDIVQGISLVLKSPALPDSDWSGHEPNAATSSAPYRIYNIGRGQSVNLLDYIKAIEDATGKIAIKEFLPMQKGDVLVTASDTQRLQALGYSPRVDVKEGISRFVAWYLRYYASEVVAN